MTDTKQTSIQLDDEWREAVDEIATLLKVKKGRHTSHILRLSTMHYLEQVRKQLKVLQEQEPN